MTVYDLSRYAIELAPLILVPALMYAFRRLPKVIRLTAVVLLGWLGLFLLVEWYWSFSINHAPNQRVAEDLAMSDGAPMTFASVFGWLYVVVYIAIIESGRFMWSWARRRRQSLRVV